MSQTYYALLTAVGEAKIANAAALGTQLQISRMAVGDGNGVLPAPDRNQTALARETYRADLNELKVDPLNTSQIVAELVIPETEGGYWLREMGLYDAAGDLIAVANCPPSYKPQMSEGSGRTQIMRMVLIVSSTTAIQLKIDPSIVLATRAYADAIIVAHLAAADPHPQYTTEAEVNALIAASMNSLDSKQSVLYTTTGNISLSGLAVQAGGDWDAALPAGARVLVRFQTAGKDNGIYTAVAGAWARTQDADSNADITSGMLVTVEQGVQFADTVWELTTNGPIVVGTTALLFELTAATNATQADAEGGTNNVRRMTALRVFQAIRSTAATATELLRGVLRVGTQVEVDAGALDDVAVTPKKLFNGALIVSSTYLALKLPSWLGGWIIQRGSFAVGVEGGAHTVSVTLPIAYTVSYSLSATFWYTGTRVENANIAQPRDKTLTGFLVDNQWVGSGSNLAGTIDFITIGK
jgi:phage-related tail fiber protein